MKRNEWIPYVIALVALLIGAFQDYQITDTLFQSVPYIGVLFERFVLVPIELVLTFTMCMLYTMNHQYRYIVLAYIASYYIIWDFQHYWKNSNTVLLFVLIAILSVVVVLLVQRVVSRLPKKWIDQHISFFVFMTTVFLCALLITTILKSCWGRIRYRDLQDVGEFCVWYRPSGMTGYNSFPSGHTTTVSVILCVLQWKVNRYEKTPVARYLGVGTLIVVMGITRMIMGAHFLSDIAAGFIVTYTCYLVIRQIFLKRGYL